MPASRFPQRRRAFGKSGERKRLEHAGLDMLSRRMLLCDELARIDTIVGRLGDRRRLAPDLSTDDLLDLLREERDHLFAQLQAVDQALDDGSAGVVSPDAEAGDIRHGAPAVTHTRDSS